MGNALYNPVFDITYDCIEQTESPKILKYKSTISSNQFGLITCTGKELTGEVLLYPYFRIVELGNSLVIQYRTINDIYNHIGIITFTGDNVEIRDIYKSFLKKMDRVTPKGIIVQLRGNDREIIDFNGKQHNTKTYINIIDNTRTGELIGINPLDLSAPPGYGDTIDILDLNGEIKREKIHWTNKLKKQYAQVYKTTYSKYTLDCRS